MNEKRCLESFVSDIDRIISAEPITISEYENCDQEYQELLSLAQLLAKADYTTESQGGRERVVAIINNNGELEDDDLDMVAGGINPDALVDGNEKKKY